MSAKIQQHVLCAVLAAARAIACPECRMRCGSQSAVASCRGKSMMALVTVGFRPVFESVEEGIEATDKVRAALFTLTRGRWTDTGMVFDWFEPDDARVLSALKEGGVTPPGVFDWRFWEPGTVEEVQQEERRDV